MDFRCKVDYDLTVPWLEATYPRYSIYYTQECASDVEFVKHCIDHTEGLMRDHLSQVLAGRANPSTAVLKKLCAVLFQRTGAGELVVPAKVLPPMQK